MYISARIKPRHVYHGYDENRKLIIDEVLKEEYVEKLIQVERILSITEDHIFIKCPHDTVQTWDYEGGFDAMKARLVKAGLLID